MQRNYKIPQKFIQFHRTWHWKRNISQIINAVRSPPTAALDQNKLVTAVIDEVVKRSLVPRNEFTKLIIGSRSLEADFSSLLKNLSLKSCSLQVLPEQAFCKQLLSDFRKHDDTDENILVANIYLYESSELCWSPSELMTPLPHWNRKTHTQSTERSFVALALALTTRNVTHRMGIHPLAVVKEIQVDLNFEMKFPIYNDHESNIGSLLTHLSHALPLGKLGGIRIGSEVIVLEKLIPKVPKAYSGLPELTLYTKDPCPLCDELVAELEENFLGEFELKKVYIDQKDNIRFLRLFRYDIPVLFLNGQFICMHRFNKPVLREHLTKLKEQSLYLANAQ